MLKEDISRFVDLHTLACVCDIRVFIWGFFRQNYGVVSPFIV